MNLLRRLFSNQEELELSFPKDVAKQLTEACDRSPDLGRLEESEFQLLFSPDRTMRGCKDYSLIEDSAFVCNAFTLKRFNYYQQRDGLCIPLFANANTRHSGYTAPPLKIKGELHAVRSGTFANLDKWKDNLVSFHRQRVKLLIPHSPRYKLPSHYPNGKPLPLLSDQYVIGAERTSPVEAWMYVADQYYWTDLLDGGFLFTHVDHYQDKRPWLGAYYSLKRDEYF